MNSFLTLSTIIAKILAIIIVITTMGFTKAYVSYKLGDVAIKNMGKLSLNPKKHFEIIGFFIFLLCGYGWTAPIDTSSLYYKNRKRDSILVCILPLVLAILFAFICQLIFTILPLSPFSNNLLSMFFNIFLSILSLYFVNFAIFNLIPIYPLFGQKLFQNILPSNKAIVLAQYEKILQIAIILLLVSGLLSNLLNYISVFILNIISFPISFLL